MKPSKPLVVVIAGPTAVGKTAIAINLATSFQASIISADSRQVYRELKIGVGRPSEAQLSAVPHYCIAHIGLDDHYHAGAFEREALELIEKEFQKSNIVFVVGGTGLYIKALCEGMDEMPEVKPEIRATLSQRLRDEGPEFLRSYLLEHDPATYHQIDISNPMRMLRAVEVVMSSGLSYASFKTGSKKERPFEVLKIALDLPRAQLYAQIDQRVEAMLADGWLEEAKQLLDKRTLKALQTVGYKELFEHLLGHLSYDEAVQQIKFHTHQYAKRQLTWIRKDTDFHWFQPQQQEDIKTLIASNLPLS